VNKNRVATVVIVVIAVIGYCVAFTPDLSNVVDFIYRALIFAINHG